MVWLKMVIKRYRSLPNILLLLAVVVYTLGERKNGVFALENRDTERVLPIEATAHVDRNEITIGDKLKFGIRVTYKDGMVVQFPELDQQLGVFAVKKTGIAEGPKREKGGRSTVECYYVLSSYEIGSQTIPSLKIKYGGIQGEGEIITHEIPIDVKGVLQEGEIAGDIKDIIPPGSVPVSFKRLFPWIGGVCAVILMSGIIAWLIKKRKKREKGQEGEFKIRLPHEIAYELLEGLLKEDLITRGLIKEYYYRLTGIVRHYIENRFGLLAPERTTEEFLAEMAHTNKLDDTHKRLIHDFLEQCDMVKYATYGPSKIEIQETYDAAKRLIDETRERLEEKEVVPA
ncbi:MAG: hypothetical protein CV087_14875 [Candidatus Brocadia sp. WS118]|nr:MAG: hypothetical protein CV087_14875 [Candidatus Brocadia sp. WS118]